MLHYKILEICYLLKVPYFFSFKKNAIKHLKLNSHLPKEIMLFTSFGAL